MKLSRDKGRKFSWEGLIGWAYNEKTDFPNATAAYIETISPHGKIKNTVSDIVYFVVEGKGEFYVGVSWFFVEKNDVIIIPKNTPYDFRAINSKLKLFLVHTPGYSPDDDVKLA